MNTKEIPFGYIKEDKIYLKSWGGYPDREIGEVRDNDQESSVAYFTGKYGELVGKIEELEETIDNATNKGSFLMKLIHLKELLPQHDGLGDYQTLMEKLSRQEALLKDIIEKNREKNTEIKRALIQEIKAVTEIVNWREATEKVHDIKARWIKTGNASDDLNKTLEEEFWEIVTTFFNKKKAFYEDKQRLIVKRKAEYAQLVQEAEKVADLTGKERFELIKTLKSRWETLDNIPKEDYYKLSKQFSFLLKRKKTETAMLDLPRLAEELGEYLNGKKPYHYQLLDEVKKSLSRYRPVELQERKLRKEAFSLLQLLMERDFLDKLALKRFKDFKSLAADKKKNIRTGILEELIHRDRSDLAKFQENSANFSASTEDMRIMVEKKIAHQQNKIDIKERLMRIINEE